MKTVSATNQNSKGNQHPLPFPWFRLVSRMLFFLMIWWGLTGDLINSWWLGAPVSLAAAFVSIKVEFPTFSPRWRAIPLFIIYFIKHTFIGSVDVAMRALHLTPAINPTVFHYHTRLQEKPPCQFFITVLGLFPGTLCVAKESNHLIVHAIDRGMMVETELRHLEGLVAALFDVEGYDE